MGYSLAVRNHPSHKPLSLVGSAVRANIPQTERGVRGADPTQSSRTEAQFTKRPPTSSLRRGSGNLNVGGKDSYTCPWSNLLALRPTRAHHPSVAPVSVDARLLGGFQRVRNRL